MEIYIFWIAIKNYDCVFLLVVVPKMYALFYLELVYKGYAWWRKEDSFELPLNSKSETSQTFVEF